MAYETGFWTADLEGTVDRMNACLLWFGVAADLPAAASANKCCIYWETDTGLLKYSDGSSWNILTHGNTHHTDRSRTVFVDFRDTPDDIWNTFITRQLTDGVDETVTGVWQVPADYVSLGSIKVVYTTLTVGNMYWKMIGEWAAHNEAITSDTPAYGTTSTTSSDKMIIQEPANPLTLTGLAAGDIVAITIERDGTHANDTVNDDVQVIGFQITYTADQ